MNFMAAIGPDFKTSHIDTLPVSNADVGITAAKLLGLNRKANGNLIGRVMTEAMLNGVAPRTSSSTVSSKPDAQGLRTVLKFQRVAKQRYFDVAGFPLAVPSALTLTSRRRPANNCSNRAKKTAGKTPPLFSFRVVRPAYMPMSNTFGSWVSGKVAAPTMVATSVISVRLLTRLARIWLAIHASTSTSTLAARVGAQLSIAVSGDSATIRDGTARPEAAAT